MVLVSFGINVEEALEPTRRSEQQIPHVPQSGGSE